VLRQLRCRFHRETKFREDQETFPSSCGGQ
jgi:hypothetical protein